MKFNFALVVSLSLASFAAFAQDAPNPDVYKDKEALKKWESGESKFPPRPKNMPQVAIHAGHFMYAGDVTPRAGYGFGLSIEKALGYVFSLRLDGMYGEAKGLNYKPLAVGQMAANPVISKVTGYNAANRYYVKYRSDYYAASLQGVVHLGNLLFNGPPTKWGAYAYGGLGVNIYDTYYDLLKGTDPN